MSLSLIGHEEDYAITQLLTSLFGQDYEAEVTSSLCREPDLVVTTTVTLDGNTTSDTRHLSADLETVSSRRRLLQQSLYQAALPHLDAPPPWGAVSGVRPTKITTKLLSQGVSPEDAKAHLESQYFISPGRAQLCVDCSQATLKATDLLTPQDISLYIGIPFCPTRCTYCSFVSQSTQREKKMLPAFLEVLLEEIARTGELLKDTPCRIVTVYMGGGTPTTLSADQMDVLMDALASNFDLSHVTEYTIEGGRPDTLDLDKLTRMRKKGANRMSINPQTMIDSVLETIGRNHTTAQTIQAYHDAKSAGFEGINMDLIAGLPGDTVEGFASSLKQCIDLDPTNITVHTLAVKRGSTLNENKSQLCSRQTMAQMVDYAEETLRNAGYVPYYLYRQKYMAGSFENVGWCKPGWDGLYNIYMMEEIHSIFALGGGGMNKVNLPGGKLERFHNPKFPKEYMERIEQTLAQKRTMIQLIINNE